MKLKGKAGLIFTIIAGAGMIITIVLTAKKAPEAQAAKDQALQAKRETTGDPNAQLTKMESLKAQAPCYAPVLASAAATTASLIGSQVLPQQAINDLNRWKNAYMDISREIHGPKATEIMNQMVEAKAAQDAKGTKNTQVTDAYKKETFVIQFNGKDIVFETTLVDVLNAEYDSNRFFTGTGGLTFNQMLDLFHLKHEGERGEEFGWDQNLGDIFYGYCWIDFRHRRGMYDGRPVTYIEFPFSPHPLDEDENTLFEEINSEYQNHGIEGTA